MHHKIHNFFEDICNKHELVKSWFFGKTTHSLSSGLKGCGHDVGSESSILGNSRLRQQVEHPELQRRNIF